MCIEAYKSSAAAGIIVKWHFVLYERLTIKYMCNL